VFREQSDILKKDYNVEIFYAFQYISDKNISPVSYIYSFRFKKQLSQVLSNNSFDCIIIHNYNSALSPSVLDTLYRYKKRNSCRIIHYAHDFHLVCPNRGYNYFLKGQWVNFQNPPALSDILFKRLDARGFGYSLMKKLQWILAYTIGNKQKVFDLVLSPSDFLARQIQSKYPEMNVQRMYNVCNSLDIEKPSAIREKRSTLRMVYFGRLDPVKGLVNFIEAIRHSTVVYSFTIIGEGEEFGIIQDRIARYGLQNKVALKPKQNQADLFAALLHYDVFVLPSLWYENAPLSIVEAASLGLGLFLANHGGVLEIGKICNADHFFNPFDPKDIVSKLEVLYKDFLDNALPKANPERLHALFSREIYIENLKRYLL